MTEQELRQYIGYVFDVPNKERGNVFNRALIDFHKYKPTVKSHIYTPPYEYEGLFLYVEEKKKFSFSILKFNLDEITLDKKFYRACEHAIEMAFNPEWEPFGNENLKSFYFLDIIKSS
jgi:hypothetical protein